MLPALALALFALATQPAATASNGDNAAETAIRTIVADQVVAWNAGDAKRYASHLAPDASFTNLFGMVIYARRRSRSATPISSRPSTKARPRNTRSAAFASSPRMWRSSTSTMRCTV